MSEEGHHPAVMSPVEQRVAALEALLTERGLVPEGFIEEITRRFESEIGPMNGAKVVARAWTDAEYKERLLAEGTAAIAELGFGGAEGDHMVVVENTPAVHNVIVCTLCSCYPWPTLGLPPAWYKDPPYRAPDGPRAPGVAGRNGLPVARRCRDPGVGLLGRGSLSRPARAPTGDWGHDRGGAGGARYPRLDDRRGPPVSGHSLSEMDLPRRNGELAFDAPWQPRVFGLAAAVVSHAFGGDSEPFRQQLIVAIAAEPGRPYWESWTAALEVLVETLPEGPAS